MKSESSGLSAPLILSARQVQATSDDKNTKFTNFPPQSLPACTNIAQSSSSVTSYSGKLKDLLKQDLTLSDQKTAVPSLPGQKFPIPVLQTVVNSAEPAIPGVYHQTTVYVPTFSKCLTSHTNVQYLTEAGLASLSLPCKPGPSVEETRTVSSSVAGVAGNLSKTASQTIVIAPQISLSEKSTSEQERVSLPHSQLSQPEQPRMSLSNSGLSKVSLPGPASTATPQQLIFTKSFIPQGHQATDIGPPGKFKGVEGASQNAPFKLQDGGNLGHVTVSGPQFVTSCATTLPQAFEMQQLPYDGHALQLPSSKISVPSQANEKSFSHTLLHPSSNRSPPKVVQSLPAHQNICSSNIQSSTQQSHGKEGQGSGSGMEVKQQLQGLHGGQSSRQDIEQKLQQHSGLLNGQNMQDQSNLSSGQLEPELLQHFVPSHTQQQLQPQNAESDQQQKQEESSIEQQQPRVLGDFTLITVVENGISKLYLVPKNMSSASTSSLTPSTFLSVPSMAIPLDGSFLYQGHSAPLPQEMESTPGLPCLVSQSEVSSGSNVAMKTSLATSFSNLPHPVETPSSLMSVQCTEPGLSAIQNSGLTKISQTGLCSSLLQLAPSVPSQPSSSAQSNLSLNFLCTSSLSDQLANSKPRVSSTIQRSPYDNSKTGLHDRAPSFPDSGSSTSLQNSEVSHNLTHAMQDVNNKSQSDRLLQVEPSNSADKISLDQRVSASVASPSSVCSKQQSDNGKCKAISSKDKSMSAHSNANEDNQHSQVETQILDSPISLDRTQVQQLLFASNPMFLNRDSSLSFPSDLPHSSQRPETVESHSCSPLFVPRSDILTGNLYTDGVGLPSDLMFHPVTCSPSSVFDALSDSPVNHQHMTSFLNDFVLSSCRRLSFSGQPMSGAHAQTTLTSPVQHEFFSKLLASNRSGSSSSSRQSPVLSFSSSYQASSNPGIPTQSLISLLQGGEDSLSKVSTTTSPICVSEATHANPSELVPQPTTSAGVILHPPALAHSNMAQSLSGIPTAPDKPQNEQLSSSTTLKTDSLSDGKCEQLDLSESTGRQTGGSNVKGSAVFSLGIQNSFPLATGSSQALSTNYSEPVAGSAVMVQTSSSNLEPSTHQTKSAGSCVDATGPRSRLLLEKLLRSGTPASAYTSNQSSGVVKSAAVTETSPSSTASSLLKVTGVSSTSTNSTAYGHSRAQGTKDTNFGQMYDVSSEMLTGQPNLQSKSHTQSGNGNEGQQNLSVEKTCIRSLSPPACLESGLSLSNIHAPGNTQSDGNKLQEQKLNHVALSNSTAVVSSAAGQSHHALGNNQNQSFQQRIEDQDLPSQQGSTCLLLPQRHANSGTDHRASQFPELHQVLFNSVGLTSSSAQGSAPSLQLSNVQNFQQQSMTLMPADCLSNLPSLTDIPNSSATPHTFEVVSASGQKQQLLLIPQQPLQEKQQQFPQQVLQQAQQISQQPEHLSQQLQQLQQISQQPQQLQQLSQQPHQAQLSLQSQPLQQISQQPQQIVQQAQQLSQQPQQLQQLSQQPQQSQQLSQQPQQLQQLSQQPQQLQQLSQQPQQLQQLSQQPQQLQQLSQQPQQLQQLSQQPQHLQQISQQPQLLVQQTQQLSQRPQQLQQFSQLLQQHPQQPTQQVEQPFFQQNHQHLQQQEQLPQPSQQPLHQAQQVSQKPKQLLPQPEQLVQQVSQKPKQLLQQPEQLTQQIPQQQQQMQQFPQMQQSVQHVQQITQQPEQLSQQPQKLLQGTQNVPQGSFQYLSQPVIQLLQQQLQQSLQQPQLLLQHPQQLSQQALPLNVQSSQSTAQLGLTSSAQDQVQCGVQQIQAPTSAKTGTDCKQISSADSKSDKATLSNSSVQLPTSEGQKWMTVPISDLHRSTTTPGPSKPPKQRRLMPKLAPVPQQAKGKLKSSYILVPDKPGYPSLPLSSIDPQGLSWLTPGQTVQIRTIAPQAESSGGPSGQPVILNAGGQQLLVQQVPGQLANLSQMVSTSVQPGMKLWNVPLGNLCQSQITVAQPPNQPNCTQVTTSAASTLHQSSARGQPSIHDTQLPQDWSNEHQKVSIPKVTKPSVAFDQEENRTVTAAGSAQLPMDVTSSSQTVIATSVTPAQSKAVSTQLQDNSIVEDGSNISHSNLDSQQIILTKKLDIQDPEGLSSSQSNSDSKLPNQLSILQQQNQVLQSTVASTTAQRTAEALPQKPSQPPLLLQQLVCGPGHKLILTSDGIVTTSIPLSSPLTFSSMQLHQRPPSMITNPAQTETSTSNDVNCNPSNKGDSHVVFPCEPSSTFSVSKAGSSFEHSQQISATESNTCVSTAHSAGVASSTNARQDAVDKASLPTGVSPAINMDRAKENLTHDDGQVCHHGPPLPESNFSHTLTLRHNEVIDLTDDNAPSPQSNTKKPVEEVLPVVEKHPPHSNLLFKELSKTFAATRVLTSVTNPTTRVPNEQDLEQRGIEENLKQHSEDLRFVSYQHIQTPPQRTQQQPQKSPNASLSGIQVCQNSSSSSSQKLMLPSSCQSHVPSSNDKTSFFTASPEVSKQLPKTSLPGNMVLVLPKDVHIGQFPESTLSYNAGASQGITWASHQSVPTSSTSSSLSSHNLSPGDPCQTMTNTGNVLLTIAQSSVALPTPVKSQPVETPLKFTSSSNQSPNLVSEITCSPRISASLESVPLPIAVQGLRHVQDSAMPPSYIKASSVPLSIQMSISSKLSSNSEETSVSTPGPQPINQLNTSSTIRRPSSIPISVAAPRLVNMSTSQAPTFRRTSNTPTDAVGPPNITIVSPSGSRPAHLLKFNSGGSSTSTPTVSIQQPMRSSRDMFREEQASGSTISLASIDSTCVRARASVSNLEPLGCKQMNLEPDPHLVPSGSGYCFNKGHKTPKEAQGTVGLKQSRETYKPSVQIVPTSATDNSAEAYRERLIQSHLNPGLKKPNKPRKRSSTINDLLKMKNIQVEAEASKTKTAEHKAREVDPQPKVPKVNPVQEVDNPAPIAVMLTTPGQNSNLVLVTNRGATLKPDPVSTFVEGAKAKAGSLRADDSGIIVPQPMADHPISSSNGRSGQRSIEETLKHQRNELSQSRDLYQPSSSQDVTGNPILTLGTDIGPGANRRLQAMLQARSVQIMQEVDTEAVVPEVINAKSLFHCQPQREAELENYKDKKSPRHHLKLGSQLSTRENPSLPFERTEAGNVVRSHSQWEISSCEANMDAFTSKGAISSHNPTLPQFLFNAASDTDQQTNSQIANHSAGQSQALWNEKSSPSILQEHLETISRRGYTGRAPPAYEEATRGSKGFVGSHHSVASASHENMPFSLEQKAFQTKEQRDTHLVHSHERITKVIDDIYTPEEQKPSGSNTLDRQKPYSFTITHSKLRSADIPGPSSEDNASSQVSRESNKDVLPVRKMSPRDSDQNVHGWKVPGTQRRAPSKGKSNAHLKRVQFSEDISMQQTASPLGTDGISSSHSDARTLWDQVSERQQPVSHDQVILKHQVKKQSKRIEQDLQLSLNLAPAFADYRHLSQDTLKPTPTTKPLSVVRHTQSPSDRSKASKLDTRGGAEDVRGRAEYMLQQGNVDLEDQATSETASSLSLAAAQDLFHWRDLQERADLVSNSNSDSRPSSFKIISPQGYSRLNRQRLLSTTSSESSCSPQVEFRPFPQHSHQSQQHQQSTSQHISNETSKTTTISPLLPKKVPKNIGEDKIYKEGIENVGGSVNFARDSLKVFHNIPAERLLSHSPAIRHDVIQADYKLSQQMMQYKSLPCFESGQSSSPLLQMRDETKSFMRPSRFDDREAVHIYSPSKFARLPSSEEELMALRVSSHSPSNSSVNSLSSDTAVNLISASSVDGALERVYHLMEGNDKLSNQNEMLRRKVNKAEQQVERFHQHQRHGLSPVPTPGAASVDSEESGIGVDGEAALASPIQSVSFQPDTSHSGLTVDNSGSAGSQWRRSKHPSSSGILKPGTSLDQEPVRMLEDNVPQASSSSGTRRRHLSSGLRKSLDYVEALHRAGTYQSLASPSPFAGSKLNSPSSEYVINEGLRAGTGDPLVSSSILRPPSQLDNEISGYNFVLPSDSGQSRHRYPSSSELKQMSHFQFFEQERAVDEVRQRNLSSAMGIRLHPDLEMLFPTTAFDSLQRQRNPSSSSVKDGSGGSNGNGSRSRNPSASSLRQIFISETPQTYNVIRSRNPSGSSNRRSRPGSSSSDREFPFLNPGDDLISIPDFCHSRSRNSSGDSNLEPTVKHVALDVIQIYQNLKFNH